MSDSLSGLRAAVADRYRVERELGSGGMATVYLARDLKHDREVALKVLRPELTAALGAERFTREIKIAAQLQHPHILPLHDSGEADGFLYYVMPYVQGESLRERLDRSGELPIEDVVRIIREIVDALAQAHEHGVVHRDLKPDNVMLSKRHALVMDFGVAKAVSEATGRQQLTTVGVALGTPAYMAPEQATADPQMDHRADIYSVGVVAYELLTGTPPFTGQTAQAILSAQVMQDPTPVTTRRASVPAPLADLVMRCLAKTPADRWQSAEEMLAVLEGLTSTSGGITPVATRPIKVVRLRNRNAALIAAAVVGAGVVAAAGFLLRGNDTTSPLTPIDRQVTFRGDVSAVALASDRRTIAYVADNSQSLMVQDLEGGGSNTLVRLEDPSFTMHSLYWGPGDARVFFNLFNDTLDVIASVPRLGGPLHTEVDLLPLRRPNVFFAGFSPSGEYIITAGSWIYLGAAPETMRWFNADSLTGEGTLFKIPYHGAVSISPSPDGQWIAYAGIADQSKFVGEVIGSDGSSRNVLLDGMDHDTILPFPLGWNPAGDAIYYPNMTAGGLGVARMEVDRRTGRQVGNFVVVSGAVPSNLFFLHVDDTALLYVGGASSSNLKAVELAGAPNSTEHPTSMLTGGTANNSAPGLTPDGEAVVFARAFADRGEIYIRPTRGGVERLLVRGWMFEAPSLSHDGRRFAYYGVLEKDEPTTVVVEIATGRATRLPVGDGWYVGWSPDGERLATASVATPNRFALVDLRDTSEVIVSLQCDTNCSVMPTWPVFSPNGNRIAFTDGANRWLWIVSLPDGHTTLVTRGAYRTLAWTENWIYYAREEIGSLGTPYPLIYRIAPEGGTPQLYARLPEDCATTGVTMSLDASMAVCAVVDTKPDVHIVEHFDPTSQR